MIGGDRGEVPTPVVAAIAAALTTVLGPEGRRWRMTAVRPLGWLEGDATPPSAWGLAGRLEAGWTRRQFGEGRRA
jgi:hypothetical protein